MHRQDPVNGQRASWAEGTDHGVGVGDDEPRVAPSAAGQFGLGNGSGACRDAFDL